MYSSNVDRGGRIYHHIIISSYHNTNASKTTLEWTITSGKQTKEEEEKKTVDHRGINWLAPRLGETCAAISYPNKRNVSATYGDITGEDTRTY